MIPDDAGPDDEGPELSPDEAVTGATLEASRGVGNAVVGGGIRHGDGLRVRTHRYGKTSHLLPRPIRPVLNQRG